MKTLKTAVVGLGRIGWGYHVPEVARHEGFELVAVVDPLEERRQEAREAHGVPAYPSIEDLFAHERPDLVVIASPTRHHAGQTVAALEHGAHVFCDKPMADSLEAADRMIDAARRAGRRLMVYQPHRAGSDVLALRAILARDLIGRVYMIKRTASAYSRRHDWQAFRRHAGGMLNNHGPHFVDQLLYLAGAPARRVRCVLKAVATLGDADDVVKILIETANGILVDIDINMASAHPMPPWQVLGERGSAVMDAEAKAWHVRYFRPGELEHVVPVDTPAAPGRRYGSGETIPWREESVPLESYPPASFYDRCHEHFARDLPAFVPLDESRELMRVLELCRRDAETAGADGASDPRSAADTCGPQGECR